MRKRTGFVVACLMALSMTAVCAMAQEEAVSEAAEAEMAQGSAYVTEMVPGTGLWYQVGYEGDSVGFLGEFYVFPNNTMGNDDEILPYTRAEDGLMTVDLSDIEEVDENTSITAQEVPLTQELKDRFQVAEDKYNFIDFSDSAKALILTYTYPDTSNPLVAGESTTTLLLLRMSRQHEFLEKYMCGKVWTIGDNRLAIDQEGSMNLNDGASTGSFYTTFDDDEGYSMLARFSWDEGGRFTYVPVQMTEDTIQLENIEKPGEILNLTYDSDLAAAEEAMTE